MVKDAINAVESLCRYNVLIEQPFVQIAFVLILKSHVAFRWNFTEAAVTRHNDKPLDKMDYDAGIDSREVNRVPKT